MTPPIAKPIAKSPLSSGSPSVFSPKAKKTDLREGKISIDTYQKPGMLKARGGDKPKGADPILASLSDANIFSVNEPSYRIEKYKKYFKVTLALGAVKRLFQGDGPTLFARQRITEWLGDSDLLQDPVAREAQRNLIKVLEKAVAQEVQAEGAKSLLHELNSVKVSEEKEPEKGKQEGSSRKTYEPYDPRPTVPKPRVIPPSPPPPPQTPKVSPPPAAPPKPPVKPEEKKAKPAAAPEKTAPKQAPIPKTAPEPAKSPSPPPVTPIPAPPGKTSLKDEYAYNFNSTNSLERRDTTSSLQSRLNPLLRPVYQKFLKNFDDLTLRCQVSILVNNQTGSVTSVTFRNLVVSGSAGTESIERMLKEMAQRIHANFKIEKMGDEDKLIFNAKLNFRT